MIFCAVDSKSATTYFITVDGDQIFICVKSKMPTTIRRRSYVYRRKPSTVRVAASPSHAAYTRRIKGGTVRVKSSLIRNRGLPGRGPSILPVLTPGRLYGYTVSAAPANRYKALKVAMNKNSPLAVFRRLQVLARYLKRTSPRAKRTVLMNAAWVRTKF